MYLDVHQRENRIVGAAGKLVGSIPAGDLESGAEDLRAHEFSGHPERRRFDDGGGCIQLSPLNRRGLIILLNGKLLIEAVL